MTDKIVMYKPEFTPYDDATDIANKIVALGGQVAMPIVETDEEHSVYFPSRRQLRDLIAEALEGYLAVHQKHGS